MDDHGSTPSDDVQLSRVTTTTSQPHTHPDPLGQMIGPYSQQGFEQEQAARHDKLRHRVIDPGSKTLAIVAWIVFIAAFIGVAISQQLAQFGEATPAPSSAPTASPSGAPTATNASPDGSKMAADAAALSPNEVAVPAPEPGTASTDQIGSTPAVEAVGVVIRRSVSPPGMEDPFNMSAKMFSKILHSGIAMKDSDRRDLLGQITGAAKTPEDTFRAAVIEAEVFDMQDGAIKRLETLRSKDAKKVSELGLDRDITLARAIWEGGPDAITSDDADYLTKRHDWYAKLLLTHGQPFTTEPRKSIVANGGWLIVVMLGLFGVLLIALVGGIAAAITLGIMASSGKIKARFVPPTPGGSVYIETAAVFVCGFLLFKLIGVPLLAQIFKGDSLEGAVLAGQWMLVLTIFWPVVRGVRWSEARRAMGLAVAPPRIDRSIQGRTGVVASSQRQSSVLREIGAGVFGYFAGLPLLALAMGITILVMFIMGMFGAKEGAEPSMPSNPIVEMITTAPLWQLVLLFTLATIWAPLVEETIFRGCLFRQLRGRFGIVLSALASALCFAFMHGYAIFLLMPVFTIGVIFALMREWRGSIISCITAHALHNATVLGLVGSLLVILRS